MDFSPVGALPLARPAAVKQSEATRFEGCHGLQSDTRPHGEIALVGFANRALPGNSPAGAVDKQGVRLVKGNYAIQVAGVESFLEGGMNFDRIAHGHRVISSTEL